MYDNFRGCRQNYRYRYTSTSREENEARRPHTCSRPCAFEEKKMKPRAVINNSGVRKKRNKKKKKFNIFSWRFRLRWLLAINFFTFLPGEVPSATPQPRALQLDLRVLMSAIKRYCRELSIEYVSLLPQIGGVCEIPGIKQGARRTFFVAAESTILCSIYIPGTKKLFILIVQYACVINIVIIIGIFNLIELSMFFQHRLLPGATRSPETARPRQVPPTQQPSRSPTKERASQPFGERRFFKIALPETGSNRYIFCWLNDRALDSGQSVS